MLAWKQLENTATVHQITDLSVQQSGGAVMAGGEPRSQTGSRQGPDSHRGTREGRAQLDAVWLHPGLIMHMQ